MSMNTVRLNRGYLVEISGGFDIYSSASVGEHLERITARKPANLIIDLAAVHFIESTALAVLVKVMKRAREQHEEIYLSGLQPQVRMVLELTRLDKVFEIYPTKQEALKAFEAGQ